MNRFLFISIPLLFLIGCAGTEYYYKPVGFKSASEVNQYNGVPIAAYLDNQLTPQNWFDFYKQFPEVKKYEVNQKNYNIAYAFRWNTLQKKKKWDPETLSRLDQKKIQPGDDVYKLFYAMGPPKRFVWDNTHEILLYQPDQAMVMDKGILKKIQSCPGCWEIQTGTELMENKKGMDHQEVLAALGVG